MNNKSNIFKSYIIPVVVVFTIAVTIDAFLYMNLPNSYLPKKVVQKKIEKVKPKNLEVVKKIEKPNIILTASFKDGMKSFAIVRKVFKKETFTININEKFEEYLLKSVFDDYVVFQKDGNDFKIYLEDSKIEDNRIDNTTTRSYNNALSKVFEKTIDLDKMIIKNENNIIVHRDLVDGYVSNFKQIFKEININEIKNKDDDTIDGFRVSAVAKGSTFEKIGLQKGDIIQTVNSKKVSSYADAFKIYFKMKSTDNITIGLIRGGKNMELNYEIE